MPAMVTAEETLSSPNKSPAPPSPLPTDSRPNKRKQQDEKGVGWYLKAPLRALRSMRNSYERGMTRCAATRGAGYLRGSAGGAPAMMMPRSYAVRNQGAWANASEEDIRELMKAASVGLLRAANPGVPRSQSAAPAVGRIDEDREMEFDDDEVGAGGPGIGGQGQYYPRSRSCAVVLPSRNRISDGGVTGSPSPARKA